MGEEKGWNEGAVLVEEDDVRVAQHRELQGSAAVGGVVHLVAALPERLAEATDGLEVRVSDEDFSDGRHRSVSSLEGGRFSRL